MHLLAASGSSIGTMPTSQLRINGSRRLAVRRRQIGRDRFGQRGELHVEMQRFVAAADGDVALSCAASDGKLIGQVARRS